MVIVSGLFLAHPLSAQVNVLTYHNNNRRTGENTNETVLTLSNVKSNTFGKIFTYNVDGHIYAQPLLVSGVNLPGQGMHNIVFVATQHNSVYAFDADSNTGTNGGLLWHVNLGPSAATPSPDFGTRYGSFGAILPEVGITGTPVIDPASGTLFVDALTHEGASYIHKIHALNITNGTEQASSPVIVRASVPGIGVGSTNGILSFEPKQQLQRSALTLAGGKVYVAYAGYDDTDPYHGWIIGFSATNLQQLTNYVYNTTPNSTVAAFGPHAGEGGIWMGGCGLSVDSATNLYFAVGNGSFNALNNSGGTEYGDSFIRLSTSNRLAVADYFTPYNQAFLADNDIDLGSGGLMLLPDQPGPFPRLMVGAGKQGTIYLVNRDMMTTGNNHYNAGGMSDSVVQTVVVGGGAYGMPAYFNGSVYYIASGDVLARFTLSNGLLSTLASTGPRAFPFPGSTPSVSANGNGQGIVWGLLRASPAILTAYNATNLNVEIYNSTQAAGGRDTLPAGVKFAVPTVANGKVYVGGQNALTVLGLLGGGIQFSSSNYSVPESNGMAAISVSRTGGTRGGVQVAYATVAGGTAVAGVNYNNTSGTLTWADGDGSPKSFNVTILDDHKPAGSKTINLALSGATGGAYLGTPSNAVLTIVESPLDTWKFAHFGNNATNQTVSGNLADPDTDRIINFLEYAHATDPNVADTNTRPSGNIVSNHFQLRFRRNVSATDLIYTAQTVSTLGSSWSNLATYTPATGWSANTPGVTVSESAPSGTSPDRFVLVTVTDPAVAGPGKGFYRATVR
jgi:hypothetical protein